MGLEEEGWKHLQPKPGWKITRRSDLETSPRDTKATLLAPRPLRIMGLAHETIHSYR
jgi:hypothetical protein